MVLALMAGLLVGSELTGRLWRKHAVKLESAIRSSSYSNKVSALITAIDQMYVDSVDVDSIVDKALPVILENLDPHSAYYPAEETKESNEELHGSFSGIGIQFSMQDDTIHVNSVIHGGPSEKVGVLAGDRIIYINDSLFAGRHIDSNEAVKNLKGPEGTEVKIGVMRQGDDGIIDFTIERGPIPVKSVDAAYMIDSETGYIELNKFGETTYAEVLTGLAKLSSQGCKKLVVDLRSNTGGYMLAAIQIANEFLKKGEMIVYTQGVHSKYEAEYANGRGHYQDMPMVVLIDEGSASASEIFAGAIQDNDRGTIVGRRSFGKGLVQQPLDFTDGSSIRLTIARYYTPSGRCVQKPYGTDEMDYAMDIYKRYERGEFFSADSVKMDEAQMFTTKGGRTVYGGGGIMPDVFVPQDTISYSAWYADIIHGSLQHKFALKYVDANRKDLAAIDNTADAVRYLDAAGAYDRFIAYTEKNGVKKNGAVPADVTLQLKRVLYASLIYDAYDTDFYMEYINGFDDTVLKGVEILKEK